MSYRRAGAAGLLALVVACATPAWAADEPNLSIEGALDGRSLTSIDANDPVRLHPARGLVVAVTVSNNGSRPVEVRSVRLDAKVVGLVFFTYTTRVDLTVPPGGTGERSFALDIADLGGQATGLLPARLTLLGADRSALVSRAVPVDVRGDARSVYSVFAALIAAVTLLLLIGLLLRLASHRLPTNRWSRAYRFVVPGVGLGLTLTFTLSALRILLPSGNSSTVLVLAGAAVGFVCGYLSPSQDDDSGRDDLFEEDFVRDDADDRPRSSAGLSMFDNAPAQGP